MSTSATGPDARRASADARLAATTDVPTPPLVENTVTSLPGSLAWAMATGAIVSASPTSSTAATAGGRRASGAAFTARSRAIGSERALVQISGVDDRDRRRLIVGWDEGQVDAGVLRDRARGGVGDPGRRGCGHREGDQPPAGGRGRRRILCRRRFAGQRCGRLANGDHVDVLQQEVFSI